MPCDDSICREHLSERDACKENKIRCKGCNEEFKINDNEFRSIKNLKKLIESNSYLSEEEIRLKHELEEKIGKFFQFYDDFVQHREKMDSDVYNHFQEMRFKIDKQREELKGKIDEIALKMIDDSKKHEAAYLKSLKEKLFEESSFDGKQSIANKLKELEDTFRHPNLLIETIREMHQKQEESLRDIQLKLNQMNQVKDHLKETNYFKPNLSSYNQEETSLFGSIKLNACWSNMNLFKSEILKDERQSIELIELCEFSPNDKWSLLYRGTRDGFGAKDFHSNCDGHSNTLTILKAKESEFIFGGYTTVSWESPARGKYKSDPNAFIFSLTNKENKPLKMNINPNQHESAICCHSSWGPTFGEDIHISNNSNTTIYSYSNLGFTYKHPQYEEDTDEASTFLAGSHYFQLDEIEVYQKE